MKLVAHPAFRLVAAGFPQLEAGDKVILPAVSEAWQRREAQQVHRMAPCLQAAFKEISRLKLPFPMIFRVENERRRSAGRVANRRGATKAPVKQFCGVQEFSAEKGKAFLPRWMMQNLKIRDGGRAVFTSVRGVRSAAVTVALRGVSWRHFPHLFPGPADAQGDVCSVSATHDGVY